MINGVTKLLPFNIKDTSQKNDKMMFSTQQETIFDTVSQPSQAELY